MASSTVFDHAEQGGSDDDDFVSLADHNASLWCNEQGADVTFICYDQYGKEQKIPAHKLFLVRSDVMKIEFFGPMAESNEVVIKDISAEGFKEFLKFLYMDKVEPPIVVAPQLLLCAKKYLMKGLKKRCINYMEGHLQKYSVHCLMLLQSLLQVGEGEPTLAEKCLQLIETHAEEAVECDAFLQLDSATLQIILQRDELDIDEPRLFRALVKWSVQMCLDENGTVDEQIQRELLEPLVVHIRFYHVSVDDLSKLMNEFQVLSDHTIAQLVLARQNEAIKENNPLKDAPRYRKSVEVARRLEEEAIQLRIMEESRIKLAKDKKDREMIQKNQNLEIELSRKNQEVEEMIKKNQNLEIELSKKNKEVKEMVKKNKTLERQLQERSNYY